ncbi:hypothetical protein BGZ96_003503 [Linnemannia gamsii]|uniref:HCP-like protein n=1 Tax=Linnemannia gamsii TaxID=64522 RepID=A0ABQ7K7H8_9FUNG|nr:hypothetical protein BGZ96_003503 [Linnemannia gamsii]
MTITDIHPTVQAVRRVFESGPPPSSSETMYLVCHPEPSLGKDIILWDDIKAVFNNALYVRSGAVVLSFVKGPDVKNLDPHRVAAIPGAIMDVVIPSQLGEKELSLDSLQQALPGSLQEDNNPISTSNSNTATAATNAVSRNPIGELVEEAMQNYNHIDNPAKLPPRRGPQAILAEQATPKDNDTDFPKVLTIATNSTANNSDSRLGAPQELSSASSSDFAETMIKTRIGDKEGQFTVGESYHTVANLGVSQDSPKAMEWYQKAAEQGHLAAQSNIGSLYYNGQGVPKDYSQAMARYQKAAEQGNPLAQNQIGYLYDCGHGVS